MKELLKLFELDVHQYSPWSNNFEIQTLECLSIKFNQTCILVRQTNDVDDCISNECDQNAQVYNQDIILGNQQQIQNEICFKFNSKNPQQICFANTFKKMNIMMWPNHKF